MRTHVRRRTELAAAQMVDSDMAIGDRYAQGAPWHDGGCAHDPHPGRVVIHPSQMGTCRPSTGSPCDGNDGSAILGTLPDRPFCARSHSSRPERLQG